MSNYRIKKEVAWRTMKDGTMTIISPLHDIVVTVNTTAARIVELLAEHKSKEEIVRTLSQETGNRNSDAIAADVDTFLQALFEKGVLEQEE